jgi:S-adenosylmethionine hydrolase
MLALLTDFGTQDSYVGMMKGVIASITPHGRVIDLSHDIPAGDVARAAFELWRSAPFFPKGTVFVAVVDPGVGTDRRAVALSILDQIFIGPDNGLFTYLTAKEEPTSIVEIKNDAYTLQTISNTFHGRDIFAPSAAHIMNGVEIEALGPPIDDLFRLPLPRLEVMDGLEVKGEILHADHFGNLISSIGTLFLEDDDILLEPWLPDCSPIHLSKKASTLHLPRGRPLTIHTTFGNVAQGGPVAYIGSAGLLEIAINQGRAVDLLPDLIGSEVILKSR